MAKEKSTDTRVTVAKDKEKALEIALGQIEKQFGKGSIMKLGENGTHMNVSVVPTGCLELDIALGIGGAYILCALMDLPTVITLASIIIAFSVSALIGIAFGYFPAKKAAKLNPIEALRYD